MTLKEWDFSQLPQLDKANIAGKRVLVRLDLNVPIRDGKILNDARLRACLPTVEMIAQKGGCALLLSHLGRPIPGTASQPEWSLAPIAGWFQAQLRRPIPLASNWLNSPPRVEAGQIVVLENVRFCTGEVENDPELAQKIAELCDLLVFDAFAVSHRDNASISGLIRAALNVCAGPMLMSEVATIQKLTSSIKRPLVTFTGGSKVSDKLQLLNQLSDLSDHVIVGGAMANTFLASQGIQMGRSMYEPSMLSEASMIHEKGKLLIPEWVTVAPSLEDADLAEIRHVSDVRDTDMILDLAPRAFDAWRGLIDDAKTILWNGPMGVFENAAFAAGTSRLATLIAHSDAYTVAGGGDTISAVETFSVQDRLSFVSTGGGAFLSALEGGRMPGLEAIVRRSPPSRPVRINAGHEKEVATKR